MASLPPHLSSLLAFPLLAPRPRPPPFLLPPRVASRAEGWRKAERRKERTLPGAHPALSFSVAPRRSGPESRAPGRLRDAGCSSQRRGEAKAIWRLFWPRNPPMPGFPLLPARILGSIFPVFRDLGAAQLRKRRWLRLVSNKGLHSAFAGLWRNRLGRWAVKQEVGGSRSPRDLQSAACSWTMICA